jgi:hypothetical protein
VRPIPVVPEANAAWVLIPFFGAVLLFRGESFFALRHNYDPARIFCMTPLRWIVTLNSVAPSLAAICLLSRPLKNSNYFAIVNKRKLALGKEQARGIFHDMSSLLMCSW